MPAWSETEQTIGTLLHMCLSPSGSAHSWKEKLGPWFLKIADYGKRILAGELSDFGPGAYKGAEKLGEQLTREDRINYPLAEEIFGANIQPDKEISRDELVLCWLTFIKYGRPFYDLLKERDAGDWTSAQKLLHVQELSERVAFNKLRPADKRLLFGGEFKRAHRAIIQLGVSFGLLKLTESELVEFFDEYCPCQRHKLENLKKLRQRIWKKMQSSAAPTPREPPPSAQPS